jgi:dCMP deaminase
VKEKYKESHMRTAEVYANLSSAVRLKVGCVVVKDNTIIGIGYNGMPSGWDNNCEDEFIDDNSVVTLKTKPEVLHAESNALAKVARSTNSSEGSSIFVTHAPCLDCAKLIYQSGISSVYYRNSYRNDDGLNFLKKCNLHIEKV